MCKDDLRSGMIVTCRNGNQYLVMINTCESISASRRVGVNRVGTGCITFDTLDYNNDLTDLINHDWDVMSVDRFSYLSEIVKWFKFETEPTINIWKRSEKKKYTYDQLKEILGEEFEIVKE